MQKQIHIYSCGITFTLTKELEALVQKAQVIYGSTALLAKLPTHNAVTYKITAKAKEQALEILADTKNTCILVLCSGDSLYNGFGGTITKLAQENKQEHNLIFYPNITAFQALCTRFGIAWENANLFTAHFSNALPLRKIVTNKMPIIYAGSSFSANKIAQEIIHFDNRQSERLGILADSLGTEKEKIVQATLKELAMEQCTPTAMLLLFPFTPRINNSIELQEKSCLTLGLHEAVFEKENSLITQSDIRAIILARLRLQKTGIMWDLGAGSGAVGLEVAGLTDIDVYAVEQHEARCQIIKNNQQKLGITNYTLTHGTILDTIPNLPCADHVFIGGGGKAICEIVDTVAKHTNLNAQIVVSAVTLDTYHALYSYKNPLLEKQDLLQIAISSEEVIAKNYTHFKNQNTIYLFIYKKV